MASESVRLEKLLEQRGKIENRIKQIQARDNAQKRKIDTRVKVLFGVMFQGLLVDNRVKSETINTAIMGYLKTDRDRDLIKNYLAGLPEVDFPQDWETVGLSEGERVRNGWLEWGEERGVGISPPVGLGGLPLR